MHIKKYAAESMAAAMRRIKQELGEDAVILHVRKLQQTPGTSDRVEVTAAVDPPASKPAARALPAPSSGDSPGTMHPWDDPGPASPGPVFPSMRLRNRTRSPDTRPPAPAPHRRKRRVGPSSPSPVPPRPAATWTERQPRAASGAATATATPSNGTNGRLRDLDPHLAEMRVRFDAFRPDTQPRTHPRNRDVLAACRDRLIRNGVAEEIAAHIVEDCRRQMPEEEKRDAQDTESSLLDIIAGRIPCAPPPVCYVGRPAIIALVGPTGVGKTTTLAKLAANAKLIDRLEVSLISTDTYRVGAIRQLRTFAQIADIPLSVVYNPGEVRQAIRQADDADIIFIDTVGRSQRVQPHLEELKTFIEAARPDEVHLVASATAKDADTLDAVQKFGVIPLDRLVMTKLDETTTFGAMLNVLERIELPLSYVTTGQAVPDDIELADPACLAQRILQGGGYDQPSVPSA